jgi:hypothetical protein
MTTEIVWMCDTWKKRTIPSAMELLETDYEKYDMEIQGQYCHV